MTDIYFGIISGTSVDALDVAAVSFEPRVEVIAASSQPFPGTLRAALLDLAQARYAADPIDTLGELDRAFAETCVTAVHRLRETLGDAAPRVRAIGCHGQTIRHRPPVFTLQIGDPNYIAAHTGLPVVADFRRKDLAWGGQGAPLVPAFHAAVFAPESGTRAILNIGGFANLSLLRPGEEARGWDVGPGNALMDEWHARHRDGAFDADGSWAASQPPDAATLALLRAEPWLRLPPPKSTGRELFNLDWALRRAPGIAALDPAVVQSTFCALTVTGIVDAVREVRADELVLCGGGVHNGELVRRLRAALPAVSLLSTLDLGLDPDQVEAAAFAWLARETLAGQATGAPRVTGARRAAIQGGIYLP